MFYREILQIADYSATNTVYIKSRDFTDIDFFKPILLPRQFFLDLIHLSLHNFELYKSIIWVAAVTRMSKPNS